MSWGGKRTRAGRPKGGISLSTRASRRSPRIPRKRRKANSLLRRRRATRARRTCSDAIRPEKTQPSVKGSDGESSGGLSPLWRGGDRGPAQERAAELSEAHRVARERAGRCGRVAFGLCLPRGTGEIAPGGEGQARTIRGSRRPYARNTGGLTNGLHRAPRAEFEIVMSRIGIRLPGIAAALPRHQ